MATSRCEPPPEELAAIVAAVTLVWPTPAAPEEAVPPVRPRRAPSAGWRFSGRWWAPSRPGARR